VEEILAYLDHGTLAGTDEPLRIYLTCYQILQANRDPRGDEILVTAHTQLQERATQIEDETLQRSFFENIAAHREIVAAYRQRRGERMTICLPRAGVPTGRPLRKDETVAVTWTVAAPEDDAIHKKTDRRHQRLLRLLREADAQGAEVTVDALAEVLDVSTRTIKRDLAALRAAGHIVTTRGNREP
jgi:hypothetical protein